MTAERRGKHRAIGPFEVTWSGTSGHRHVRVADFSLSGCFIEDIATPVTGERVTLTLRVPGGSPIEAAGHVAYVNPPLGFAVAFEVDERVASELAAAARRVSQRRR
ncbi:PilZ domain-containing protein [Luteitalea pratensis]|nr:PilZ domain-containing protein [Luteitalea pratensis]